MNLFSRRTQQKFYLANLFLVAVLVLMPVAPVLADDSVSTPPETVSTDTSFDTSATDTGTTPADTQTQADTQTETETSVDTNVDTGTDQTPATDDTSNTELGIELRETVEPAGADLVQSLASDTTSPTNPEVVEATHLPNSTTTAPATVNVGWTQSIDPVVDGQVTSGLAGYSFIWDTATSTTPDNTVENASSTIYTQTLTTPGDWYFHVKAIDYAGNTSDTNHFGPVIIEANGELLPDTTGPSAPEITDSSHNPNATSTDNVVNLAWSQSVDPEVAGAITSGLAGYSYVWDQVSSNVPDLVVDATSTMYTQTLANGTWYFHIRALDNAGNSSSPVTTFGPIIIDHDGGSLGPDTTSPTNPEVVEATHLPNSTTTAPATVNVGWTQSIDPVVDGQVTSGLAGYSFIWDTATSTTPDNTVENASSTIYTQTLTTPGDWYFHVKAIDYAGNTSDTNHFGPIIILAGTTTPPQCSDTVDNDGDGKIDSADPGCTDPTDNDETDPTPPGGGGGGGGGGGSSSGGGGGFVTLATAAPTLPNTCPVYLKQFIRLGENNDVQEVRKLQAFLKVFEGANVEVTGTYTQADFEAVQAFQQKYANDVLGPWGIIDPTGYVYITTTLAINNIYCNRSTANDLDLRNVFGANIPADIGQNIEPVIPEATTTPEVATSTATTTLQNNASTTPGFFQAAAIGVLKFISSYPWWWWLIIALIIVLLIWSLQADDNLSDKSEDDSPIDSNTPTQ